jgi:isopentenyl-diphosphate delta-isomerase
MEKQVVLVNEQDAEIGIAGKMEAHEKGLLHRAFSVFIFNSKGEMLLQQRALQKYHSGGLWTNACCSHPEPGEHTETTVHNRLLEEMGFSVPVNKCFEFIYKADFENGLTEYEFDHVFTGEYDGPVKPNPDEVMSFRFMTYNEIKNSLSKDTSSYTAWFQLAFPQIEKWWLAHYSVQLKSS